VHCREVFNGKCPRCFIFRAASCARETRARTTLHGKLRGLHWFQRWPRFGGDR
jgi:hypothetical protein